MTYAAILTHVQADPETGARLTCAADLAQRFGAAMVGVGVEMVPPLAFDGGYYALEADWAATLRDSIATRLKQAQDRFHVAAQGVGAQALWRQGVQLPIPALAAASRAADLIVAGGAPRKMHDPYRDADPGALALTAGRPVLVVPPVARKLAAEQVLVAWKDSREARRALSDALPFLGRAARVVIVAVSAANEAADARIAVDDVAESLRRRSVKAEGKVVEHARPDGLQILRAADAEGADLIVTGAYGHSRLGEWAFGGVTAELLAQDHAFVLFSH